MQTLSAFPLDSCAAYSDAISMKNTIFILALILTSVACAHMFISPANAQEDDGYKKREAAVKQNMALARRLENIAGPLRIKLAENCGEQTAPFIGAEFATTDSVGESYQAVMKNLYNTGLRPTVTMIAKQSPAAKTLKVEDMITHINSVALSKNRDSLDEIKAAIRQSNNKPLNLTLIRGNETKTITLNPVNACNKPARIVGRGEGDVFVDDTKIGVSKKLLKSSASDEKIAAQIEEELLNSLN